jgi:hypothetical protein
MGMFVFLGGSSAIWFWAKGRLNCFWMWLILLGGRRDWDEDVELVMAGTGYRIEMKLSGSVDILKKGGDVSTDTH